MNKKNITEDDLNEFKKDMFELIKMHGEKIDKVLKQDPPPTPPIPNPNPAPNIPRTDRYLCACDIFIVIGHTIPDPKERAEIKVKVTQEVSALMDKYKISKLSAELLKVHD